MKRQKNERKWRKENGKKMAIKMDKKGRKRRQKTRRRYKLVNDQ